LRYFVQRFGQFLIVFFIVTFGVMVLMRLGLNSPGDPARTMLGGTADEALIARTTARYRLDQNYLVQYWFWLKGMITGDMGFSVRFSSPVGSLMIAVPLAIRSAYKRDGIVDRIGSAYTFLFVSVPAIVLAPLLRLAFVEKHEITAGNYVLKLGGWFPSASSKIYPWQDLGSHVNNFLLPVVVLTLPLAAIFTRLLRGDMVITLQSDFITLASAKGVSPRRILWGHALRNSLFSLLTSIGVQLGAVIGGALVVEAFFDLDGMGSLLLGAIIAKDLFTVQSVAALLVACVVLVNLVIDLLYAVIDPRIRHARALG